MAVAVAVVTGVAVSQAAAPSGYNAAYAHVVNPSAKTGGTLKLLTGGDCDSWDPARTYYGYCWNLQRLFTRTLVGYRKVNGSSFRLAPDLATSMGHHNASFTTWRYTLKPGLRFSTGKAIRPLDVKYGIERLFATDVINGGPSSYFLDSIAHKASYRGPYRSGDLKSIATTNRTITFHLAHPYADFDYLMALPAAAPVPYKVEGGKFHAASYRLHPVASGPFKIKSYRPNHEIVFVRNPYWKQSTDTIRHPKAAQVTVTVDRNLDDIDQKLQSGKADARADNGVEATFASMIRNRPQLKQHADDPVTALTRYAAVMQSVIPNVHCRRAIFDAWNKAGALRALGGAMSGQIANSMTPPGLTGHQGGYDPYSTGRTHTGNVTAAKRELRLCGKPNGFATRLAYATPSSSSPNIFKVERSALGRVGIRISALTADASNYYSTFIGSPANVKRQGIGVALAAWGPDFPTGLGFYDDIVGGKSIRPVGNTNYASLNNRAVNQVLAKAQRGKAGRKAWVTLDHAVMKSAVYLPYVYGRTLYYRNPRMTNVTCNVAEAFGIYDFVNIGVRT
jgi:peptide/nickel transport system substrate-binding protein